MNRQVAGEVAGNLSEAGHKEVAINRDPNSGEYNVVTIGAGGTPTCIHDWAQWENMNKSETPHKTNLAK